MALSRALFGQMAEMVLEGGAKRVTKYVSDNLTVKATLQGRRDQRSRSHTLLVTVGAPNFAERAFIRKCKRAGEPFPVKRLQIQWPAKRKAA